MFKDVFNIPGRRVWPWPTTEGAVSEKDPQPAAIPRKGASPGSILAAAQAGHLCQDRRFLQEATGSWEEAVLTMAASVLQGPLSVREKSAVSLTWKVGLEDA